MVFGPKRAHVMFIFENFIKDFGLFLIALIIFLVVRDIDILMENLFIVAIALFGPLSRLVKFFCTKYTINSECLLVESGFLKKEKMEIPLATVSSVDMMQNIIFQVTGVYALQVENAASIGTADGAVKLILGKDDADIARKMLLAKKDGMVFEDEAAPEVPDQQEGKTMRASVGEVLTMCVFQIKWVVIGLQMIAYLSLMTTYLDQLIFTDDKSSTEVIVDYAVKFTPVMIVGIILGAYLVSVIISTVAGFIKYYNFRITNKDDSIHIEYGLFTRKSHTLMKEKISGITYEQSIMMRILKKGTLQIFVTGYGGLDENNMEETVLLYPVAEEKKIYSFINWILPEQIEEPKYEKAPARGLPYFFLCFRFVFAVILCAASILVPVDGVIHLILSAVGAAILLVAIGSVIMEYKTSAVAVNGSAVTMNYGGFRKHVVLISRDKMEFAEDSASEVKRKKQKLSSINVGVLAPTGMSSHRVRNMDIGVFEKVKEKLIF